jgi:hypothetical protein
MRFLETLVPKLWDAVVVCVIGAGFIVAVALLLTMISGKPKQPDEARLPRRTGLSWALTGDDTGVRNERDEYGNQAFTVVLKGEQLWSGSPNEFIALVRAGLKAQGKE